MLATAGVSLPTFFTGLLLAYIFYFLLGVSPSPVGRLDVSFPSPPTLTGLYLLDSLLARDMETFFAAAAQLILPAVTLGLFVMAPLMRMTRASMLGVLSSDFIRTARASGRPQGREALVGEPRSPIDPDPQDCRLFGRCSKQIDRCRREAPLLREVGPGHRAACHFAHG